MSNLIVDENNNSSDFANNFVTLFEEHNSTLISNFIQQIFENSGTYSDAVIFGNILRERLYTDWLFEAAKERIKRGKSKAKNEGQIYE